MKLDTVDQSININVSSISAEYNKRHHHLTSHIVFENQCPPFFDSYDDKKINRRKRSDCTPDGYHMFSLLSFLLSSFTTVINIVNNINVNNNNNNNNNNDNNNNNNNLNVNMMSKRRRRREGKFQN